MRASMALAAALSVLGVTPARADEPLLRRFHDWQVVCDNLRHCSAFAGSESAGPGLMLERAAGPGSVPVFRLVRPFDGASTRIDVDGRPLPLAPADWSTDPDGHARQTRSLAAVQRFIDRVRHARRLADPDAEAKGSGVLSLAGFSAALLLIDEHQGRLDTPGALIRRGRKRENAVPAAPSMPVVQTAGTAPIGRMEAGRLLAAARRAHARDGEGRCDLHGDEADRVEALNAREALALLACWRGAYQEGSLPWRVQRKAPFAARLESLPSPAGLDSDAGLTSASYDSRTGMLSHFAKGRGIADCGEASQWAFDGQRFRLASHRFMPGCFGVMPDRWPWYWRSVPRPQSQDEGRR